MKGTPSVIKNVNKNLVEEFFRENLLCTKPQIAEKTGISLVTVIKIVKLLLQENKVIEKGILDSTGGRKAQLYQWNPNHEHSVGLYYMEGMIYGFVIDGLGTILYQKNTSFQKKDHIYTVTCNAIRELQTMDTAGRISTIGIGIPGVINGEKITSINSIPQLNEYPLIQQLKEEFNLPILIENDINLAAMGYYLNQTNTEVRDILLLYMEEGVGSGIILNGNLFRGKTSFAGEIGCIPVESTDGEIKNLEMEIQDLHNKIEMFPDEIKYHKRLYSLIAKAMMSIICILNPELIVITGDFSELEIAHIKKELNEMLEIENIPEIQAIHDIHKYCIQGIVSVCMEYQKSGNIQLNKGEKINYE